MQIRCSVCSQVIGKDDFVRFGNQFAHTQCGASMSINPIELTPTPSTANFTHCTGMNMRIESLILSPVVSGVALITKNAPTCSNDSPYMCLPDRSSLV